jgi:uncharacterized Zn-binding protein involved in type VI secretion
VNKSLFGVLLCGLVSLPVIAQEGSSAQPDHAAVTAAKGKMLVAANGARLGVVYRVTPDGSVQVIIDGKLATISGSTLSMANGSLTTSLTKNDVISQQ